MWHTSFKVYYFNLRPLRLKLMPLGALYCGTSNFVLLHVCLCQLHGEHGEAMVGMAMCSPHLVFYSVAGSAELNEFMEVLKDGGMAPGKWNHSKNIWDKTKPKPKKQNRSSPTAEKELTPRHCWHLQESKRTSVVHSQNQWTYLWVDARACDYKEWDSY